MYCTYAWKTTLDTNSIVWCVCVFLARQMFCLLPHFEFCHYQQTCMLRWDEYADKRMDRTNFCKNNTFQLEQLQESIKWRAYERGKDGKDVDSTIEHYNDEVCREFLFLTTCCSSHFVITFSLWHGCSPVYRCLWSVILSE